MRRMVVGVGSTDEALVVITYESHFLVNGNNRLLLLY